MQFESIQDISTDILHMNCSLDTVLVFFCLFIIKEIINNLMVYKRIKEVLSPCVIG